MHSIFAKNSQNHIDKDLKKKKSHKFKSLGLYLNYLANLYTTSRRKKIDGSYNHTDSLVQKNPTFVEMKSLAWRNVFLL